MFLSEIRLNPTRVTTRRLVGSPQVTHALVMGSCNATGDPGRVLWRLDRHSAHELLLYVVSPAAPDFTGLVEQVGWPADPSWRTASYAPLLDGLRVGQEWIFRLTANPSRTESVGVPGRRGQLRPLRTAEQQLAWLTQRTKTMGVDFPINQLGMPQVEIRAREQLAFRRNVAGGGGIVRLTTATFEGRLRVREPQSLRSVLVHGLGRAKGYGCGLMTLAPSSTSS